MAIDGIRVIDLDNHRAGGLAGWAKNVAEPFKSRAPFTVIDPYGNKYFAVDGKIVSPNSRVLKASPFAGLKAVNSDPRFAEAKAAKMSPEARVKDMDREGIDIAAIVPEETVALAEVEDAALSVALYRALNDSVADYCKAFSRRLVPVVSLPLQDGEEAAKEANRGVSELGAKAAAVSAIPVYGRHLGHRDYDPLYKALEDLGVPLVIHGGGYGSEKTPGENFFDNFLSDTIIAFPLQNIVALVGLICSGTLERFPQLKVILVESGCSWLPYWLGRMDRYYQKYPQGLPLSMRPSEYFFRQVLVSVDAYNDAHIPLAVKTLGEDHFVLATDYPHWDCFWPNEVRSIVELDIPESAKKKILGENIARVLGL